MSELDVRPTYDELERALIVRDKTIAELRQQLAAMTQERDAYAVHVARADQLNVDLKQQLAQAERERDKYLRWYRELEKELFKPESPEVSR